MHDSDVLPVVAIRHAEPLPFKFTRLGSLALAASESSLHTYRRIRQRLYSEMAHKRQEVHHIYNLTCLTHCQAG